MLKQFVALFMLLSFMAQTFSNAIIVADYYLHTDVFAASCENKDKPQLHCQGKCQLEKKLDKENKKDQTNPERKAENKTEAVSSKSFFAEIICTETIAANHYQHCIIAKPVHRPSSVFHPPCV